MVTIPSNLITLPWKKIKETKRVEKIYEVRVTSKLSLHLNHTAILFLSRPAQLKTFYRVVKKDRDSILELWTALKESKKLSLITKLQSAIKLLSVSCLWIMDIVRPIERKTFAARERYPFFKRPHGFTNA